MQNKCGHKCVIFFLGPIESVSTSCDGALFASIGADKALKVFDVINFGKNLDILADYLVAMST